MRSIPACAGEPCQVFHGVFLTKVYPRVCGGTDCGDCERCQDCGLSPRVRGNLLLPLTDLVYVRSIPACAGEPRSGSPREGWGAVYPRVCGGTFCRLAACERLLGLSPRVRGNHGGGWRQGGNGGSIPACAGEPASCARRP